MQSKTLYITDLDGTLLSADATLSRENAMAIASLTAQGALITCATARTPGTVQPLMAPAQLSAPAIVMTGAAFWTIDTPTPHFEDVQSITIGDAEIIDELFTKTAVAPFVYCVANDSIISSKDKLAPLHFFHNAAIMSDAERAFADARCDLTLKRFHPRCQAPTSGRVLYFATGTELAIRHLAESLRSSTNCSISCYPDSYTPGLYLLEVFAPGVSKASAVKRLAERLDVERIVVFGDNLNDLPMMEIADLAVAAPGALPEVKNHAHITLSEGITPIPDFITHDLKTT